MNKTILATGLLVICASLGYSQTAQTSAKGSASSDTAATANGGNKTINIASGTSLAGELQNTIDVRKAKVGDEVVLKTTQSIKSEGHTVVKKGARLIGHVTEVSQKSKASGESRIGVLFDRLETGPLNVAIVARIVSITKAGSNVSRNDQPPSGMDAGSSSSVSARSSGSAQSSSSGSLVGNVVGGVTNTVGGVVNTTTTATGDVVGNTAVRGSLGKIQISESTDASASGGSVLSLRGDNVRLEKGTTFVLVLNQSAGAGTSQ
jgi:hypothetical protein